MKIRKFNESLEFKKDVPSAVEFLQNFDDNPNDDTIYNAMIEFAKLHVRAALRSSVRISNDRASESQIEELTELAIKNEYPLENIR